jgi:hypothetical protein
MPTRGCGGNLRMLCARACPRAPWFSNCCVLPEGQWTPCLVITRRRRREALHVESLQFQCLQLSMYLNITRDRFLLKLLAPTWVFEACLGGNCEEVSRAVGDTVNMHDTVHPTTLLSTDLQWDVNRVLKDRIITRCILGPYIRSPTGACVDGFFRSNASVE